MQDDGTGNYYGANGGYGLGIGGSMAPAYTQGGYGGDQGSAAQMPPPQQNYGGGGGQSVVSQTAQGAQLGSALAQGFFGRQAPTYNTSGYSGYTGGLGGRF